MDVSQGVGWKKIPTYPSFLFDIYLIIWYSKKSKLNNKEVKVEQVIRSFFFKQNRLREILKAIRPGTEGDVLFDYFGGDDGRPQTHKKLAEDRGLSKMTVHNIVGKFQEQILVKGTGLGDRADHIVKYFQINRMIWEDRCRVQAEIKFRRQKKKQKNQ